MAFFDVDKMKNLWKGGLLLSAVGIGALTLWYTEQFASHLRAEEERRVELWAEAIESIVQGDPEADLTLATRIIELNTTIPLILTDAHGVILNHRNLPGSDTSSLAIERELKIMMNYAAPIEVNLLPGVNQFIYRNESVNVQRLHNYPRFLLAIIAAYILLAYFGFSRARKAEQDRVWTGMARETAHQLGTPLSALYGWTTLLEEEGASPAAVSEIKKDLNRLQTVAERFSKIGTETKGDLGNLTELLRHTVDYLQRRSPGEVHLLLDLSEDLPLIPMQPVLLGWVVENLLRNAMDAMDGKGEVTITAIRQGRKVWVDISDTGRGMSARIKRVVFNPGFTTKSRGWGLGLSLAKRIIESGHRGRLTVLRSVPGEGSTFRIELPY
ncbi:HAMP domain-containing histidine kinase [Schleiferiaceae bacterium]|jgi:signal transduction histidine kinase|nr:HAMP domain-containing histidine kinase [Schleiferiaceae bacterium]MDA9151531.1 HAMP domain-containing histidine kinase [Schleiferiaceae bacterium]MDC3353854.1 HAMP domain-containing histidine kinase [Schleiferiaceae bacterium]